MRHTDAAARRRAATDFDTNLVVEAGAGTGKTSLLVERVLNAVGAGLVDIDRLAAITFTEKAAGELRQRLASGLDALRTYAFGEANADPAAAAGRSVDYLVEERRVAPDDIARRAVAALQGLDRARIGTIHAFCADLLRSWPMEAGVEPGFGVDRGALYERLLDVEWESFLGEAVSKDRATAIWRRLLRRFDVGGIAGVARALASFKVPEQLVDSACRAGEALPILRPPAEALVRRIADVLSRQRHLSRAPSSFLRASQRALETLVADGVDAARRCADEEGVYRTRGKPRANMKLEGLPGTEVDAVIDDAWTMMRGLRSVDEEAAATLVEATAPFARLARRALLKSGSVGFDGLLTLARDLLRDFPDVREQVRRRHLMLLVDEFQDTDPLQYEIVLFLSGQKGERAERAFDVPLAPGRLFVVGDPKQSIYRFRGADYGAYRRAVQRVLDERGARIDLVTNFRSPKQLLDPVNALFAQDDRGRWVESAVQPRYVPIEAERESGDDPSVEVWTVDAAGRADERRTAEGLAISDGIVRLVRERGIRFRDVFLLLRAFSSVNCYLRPLREAGIPFVVAGGREFMQRPEVVQLLAVLRALVRPSDPVALLAFLRSPVGAVRDSELARYAAANQRWHRESALDPSEFPAIAAAFDLLRRLEEETRRIPADAVVRHVLLRTGLMPLSAVAFEGAQRVANLRKLEAAAADLAGAGTLSLNEVLDALEQERATDIEGDSPLADEQTDAVRVLTIHKAKGLENKIVFVGDLAREDGKAGRQSTARVEVCRPEGGAEILALAGDGVRNAASVWHEIESEAHDEAEGIRTLYVAATRAQEKLVLVLAPAQRGRSSLWGEALYAWGYDLAAPPADRARLDSGRVLHRVIRPEHLRIEPPTARATDVASAVRDYGECLYRLRELSVPPLHSPSGAAEDLAIRLERDAAALPDRAGESRGDAARAAGIVVHRLLEAWDLRDERSLRADQANMVQRIAEQESTDAIDVQREVEEVLTAFLASDLPSRMQSVTVLGREVSLLFQDAAGSNWWGQVDLLYRDADGTVVVADFKTDREIDSVSQRYAPQLSVYAAGVERAMGLSRPVTAELWLLRYGRRLEFR